MERRIALALVLTGGLFTAACSAASADDAVPSSVSSTPAAATIASATPTTSSPDSDPVSRGGEDATATTASARSDEEESGTLSDETSGEAIGPVGTGPDGRGRDSTVEGEPSAADTEDPSFDLGPDVVLDVDVARFPADDAGIGGAQSSIPAGETADDAQAPAVSGWSGVDRSLESALIRPGNTAASVAVSIDGDVVHRAAFGVRDPATGDPAQPQDRFRIASISKPITAITVMALVEDGVIGLDDPLGDVIARYVGLASANGASANLTLRQLLTHRSGFGTYDATFFRGAAADCIDAARAGLSGGVGGGGYTYSNMNFCVAGLAIEAVTGLGYEQAVYRYLLTPLGITGMRLAPTFDPGPDEIQHVTTPGRNYMETLGAAGAWVATPSDLVTIFDSLDVDSGGFKPLSVETVL